MAMTAVATIAIDIVFLPVGRCCVVAPWSLLETKPGRCIEPAQQMSELQK